MIWLNFWRAWRRRIEPFIGIGAGAWGRLEISIETMKSWCRLFIGIKLGLIINLRYMRWGQSVAVAWQYGLWRHQRDYYLILLNFFLKLESLSLFLLTFSLSLGLLASIPKGYFLSCLHFSYRLDTPAHTSYWASYFCS